MIPLFAVWSDWAFFILRLVLGGTLIVHGWPMIKNIKKTGEGFAGMGFKPGIFWGALVALLEFVGGILIFVGLFTQIWTVFVAIEFLVILFAVKKFKLYKEFEYELLILASALVLATAGSGVLSLDGFFGFQIYF